MPRTAIDITNQKFGKLTVIERHLENAKNGDSKWKCLCSCGNITIVVASKLKNGNTKSCGCTTTLNDLTGNRYGRLVVLHRHFENTKLGFPIWVCSCSCGNNTLVQGNHLRSGATKSCGCLHREIATQMNTSHGKTYSSEYRIWSGIKTRCCNKENPAYPYYGGRGITICDEWQDSFEAFYRDMGPRPSSDHSIDRKDNDKGYSKENCRWATRKEQANNRRNGILYEFDGERKTLAEWCDELGLCYNTTYYLLSKKISFEDAVYANE